MKLATSTPTQYMHFFEIRQTVSVTDQGSVVLFSYLYTFASVERLEPGEYELSSVSSLGCGGNGPQCAPSCLSTAVTTLVALL